MPDAHTTRPGAGPLDPDLTIDCDDSVYLDLSGQHWHYPRVVWQENELPRDAWLCWESPFPITTCSPFSPNCNVVGTPYETLCSRVIWQIDPDGVYFTQCTFRQELDQDGDGVFEPSFPYPAQYLAIVR